MFTDKLKCFADMMEMVYDTEKKQSLNMEGVEVRVPGFGETSSVEYIDPSWTAYMMLNAGSYFEPLIDGIVFKKFDSYSG